MCMIWVSGPSSSSSEKWNRMRYFVGRWRKMKAVKSWLKVIQAVDKELTNREGDHVIEKKKRNHVMKVRKADADDSSNTLTYLYKIGDLEEDLYVPYPAVSAVLRGVW
ncbi:hypothetical protein L249_5430, partial [Ophiocordyceps polyrhachis-furcata BCC 54312]